MQVYTGKDAGSSRETNQGTKVVLDLVEDIEKSSRNITCDYFFTNLSLARKLFQKKLTLVRTMRKNKTKLPMEFTVATGWNVKSTFFDFQQNAMIPSQQCYAGPMRVLRGLPIREPYRFGRGHCSGPTWDNGMGLIWLSILSRNQKLKHANKLTF